MRQNAGPATGTLALLVMLASAALAQSPVESAYPRIEWPGQGVTAQTLGLVINDADPQSAEVGAYYAMRRGIPAANVAHVSFPAGSGAMDPAAFEALRAETAARLPPQIRALAISWTEPFKVGCMSITAAFALGYSKEYCANGCSQTKTSAFFPSGVPDDLGSTRMRPAMMLAGPDVANVRALIDRGVRSDDTWPIGTAYLVNSPDAARNVRAQGYPMVQARLKEAYPIQVVDLMTPAERADVMFYFTGASTVYELGRLRFVDGAIADHLTSFGGVLSGGSQMSVLAWLKAGVTGSYGTVEEPCNFPGKFPAPGLVMAHYLSGDTLIEAYWKSVAMPGQGLFVGEPLARPFGGSRMAWSGRNLVIATRSLKPGDYDIQEARWLGEAFHTVAHQRILHLGVNEIRIGAADRRRVYRIVPSFAL